MCGASGALAVCKTFTAHWKQLEKLGLWLYKMPSYCLGHYVVGLCPSIILRSDTQTFIRRTGTLIFFVWPVAKSLSNQQILTEAGTSCSLWNLTDSCATPIPYVSKDWRVFQLCRSNVFTLSEVTCWCLHHSYNDRNVTYIGLQWKHSPARENSEVVHRVRTEDRCGSVKLLMTIAAAALLQDSLQLVTRLESPWSHIKGCPDLHKRAPTHTQFNLLYKIL